MQMCFYKGFTLAQCVKPEGGGCRHALVCRRVATPTHAVGRGIAPTLGVCLYGPHKGGGYERWVANSGRAQCKFGQKAKEADVAEPVKGLN